MDLARAYFRDRLTKNPVELNRRTGLRAMGIELERYQQSGMLSEAKGIKPWTSHYFPISVPSVEPPPYVAYWANQSQNACIAADFDRVEQRNTVVPFYYSGNFQLRTKVGVHEYSPGDPRGKEPGRKVSMQII